MKQQYKTKKTLIILTGPTAVGKTKLSIELAKAVNGQMISADSMQVYRHMDIGTAKIRSEEMQGIPHYLIDVLDPWESFDVVRFQTMAKEALEKIYTAGAIPIVVGGTGFYIQALLYDIDFDENDSETGYRSELQSFADRHGVEALHDRLRQVDEKSADMIHPNNIKRVIRALEFYHQTGTRISEHNETQRQKESPYRFVYFVLDDERERIYRRIDQRIDQMLDQGLVAEVKQLRDMGCTRDMVSMQGLGYKEILAYLNGECTLEEAVYILKRDTRHFAKRQLTWFRREQEVRWIERQEYPDEAAMLQAMLAQLPPEFLQNNYSF
ncbi:MAG: tRNA (adenosine(37)-N6)-dimethylallyltransferase MiaA [Lachnospiraceae bacterium]|nr:tRNA (adenosine(37)-N6)-dimethylallyltransferase MiaA [Lachnospiraceae bacterium]